MSCFKEGDGNSNCWGLRGYSRGEVLKQRWLLSLQPKDKNILCVWIWYSRQRKWCKENIRRDHRMRNDVLVAIAQN